MGMVDAGAAGSGLRDGGSPVRRGAMHEGLPVRPDTVIRVLRAAPARCAYAVWTRGRAASAAPTQPSRSSQSGIGSWTYCPIPSPAPQQPGGKQIPPFRA